jgi:hypothetical protein
MNFELGLPEQDQIQSRQSVGRSVLAMRSMRSVVTGTLNSKEALSDMHSTAIARPAVFNYANITRCRCSGTPVTLQDPQVVAELL